MDLSPKISVIVPVYNVQGYVKACLDSILAQDFSDYEVLVVDDGSTDHSGTIVDEYAAKYPEKVRTIHQKNQGLGGARNTGIEAAQGEYFLFVDSDDTIEPDTLSGLWVLIERIGAQLVLFGMKNLSEDGKLLSKLTEPQPLYVPLEFSEQKGLLFSHPSACNKLFHRDLFLKTGIRFPSKVWYEDIRTTPKLYLSAKRIIVTDRCYYRYLQRAGSIMQNANLERNLEILDAFEDIISYFKQQGCFEKYYHELEFLAIQHVLIAASVRIIRVDPRSGLIQKIMDFMEEKFPSYRHNPYLGDLGRNKKLIYSLLKRKYYSVVYWIFKIKG